LRLRNIINTTNAPASLPVIDIVMFCAVNIPSSLCSYSAKKELGISHAYIYRALSG